MHKNKQKHIFMPTEGIRREVTGDSETLAETLERLNIIIDDKCQLANVRLRK